MILCQLLTGVRARRSASSPTCGKTSNAPSQFTAPICALAHACAFALFILEWCVLQEDYLSPSVSVRSVGTHHLRNVSHTNPPAALYTSLPSGIPKAAVDLGNLGKAVAARAAERPAMAMAEPVSSSVSHSAFPIQSVVASAVKPSPHSSPSIKSSIQPEAVPSRVPASASTASSGSSGLAAPSSLSQGSSALSHGGNTHTATPVARAVVESVPTVVHGTCDRCRKHITDGTEAVKQRELRFADAVLFLVRHFVSHAIQEHGCRSGSTAIMQSTLSVTEST